MGRGNAKIQTFSFLHQFQLFLHQSTPNDPIRGNMKNKTYISSLVFELRGLKVITENASFRHRRRRGVGRGNAKIRTFYRLVNGE